MYRQIQIEVDLFALNLDHTRSTRLGIDLKLDIFILK